MRWFRKKVKWIDVPLMPSWEESVEIMRDKQLSFVDEVVRVLYSKDGAKRAVVLKSSVGYFKYLIEEICPFDEDEWRFVCAEKDTLPAYWAPVGCGGISLYGTEEEAMRELYAEYKGYFE